jgi:uncharacterized protein YkwD
MKYIEKYAKNNVSWRIVQRMLLCFLSACILSIAWLTFSFTAYQQNIAQAIEHNNCVNIPATPDYIRSGRASDAIAAINHARLFEHLHPLRLPATFYQQSAVQQQYTLVNLERADRGLSPLQMNPVLSAMALSYSRQMVRLHFFSHTSPIGGTFSQRVNSNPTIANSYLLAAENLAGNPVAGVGPIYEYLYNDAAESCGHRLNILSPALKLIGIGVVPDRTYGSISAQEFLQLRPGVTL